MKIFHAVSLYQIFIFLLYIKKHSIKSDTAVLITIELFYRIAKSNLEGSYFNLILLDDAPSYNIDEFTPYYEKILKKNIKKNTEPVEFYVSGFHKMTHYCVRKNITFVYQEDGSGSLSDWYDLHQTQLTHIPEDYTSRSLKWGLYDGTNNLISKIICNKEAQSESFLSECGEQRAKIEDINPMQELNNLSSEDMLELMDCFDVPKDIVLNKNETILFTQHLANLKICTFEEQVTIYQFFADYFLDRNLVIKRHPSDFIYNAKIFPAAKIISGSFPSEFIPFLSGERPGTIATIYSKAVINLIPYYGNSISLSFCFIKSHIHIHRYYLAARVAQQFGYMDRICIYNVDEVHFKVLVKNNTDLKSEEYNHNPVSSFDEIPQNSFTVIGNIPSDKDSVRKTIDFLQSRCENDIVIFLNTDGNYGFYNYSNRDLFLFLMPILIHKAKCRETDVFSCLDSERLFFFTKNGSFMDKMKSFNFEKKLDASGIKIEVNVPKTQEERRISVLEGILAATESKLLQQIQLNEDLEKKLAELAN